MHAFSETLRDTMKDTMIVLASKTGPVLASGHNAPLIRGYIYCLLLSFFLHFFLTNLLPYLSFPLRIDLPCFQAGCRKRRLNLALVFVLSTFSFDW